MEWWTVSEVAKLTGISVRTLHYYDEIGLLLPSKITEAGYRYYNKEALLKLQQILFYRELDFSLKEIKKLLASPDYDRQKAFQQHKTLLELKQQRLKKLILLVEQCMKGEETMEFDVFDQTAIEQAKKEYEKEAYEKWGGTKAFKQSQEKTDAYTKEDWQGIQQGMEGILKAFSECKEPAGQQAQELVRRLQEHICMYYYDCTNEILAGLGEMYVSDGRFQKSIDSFGAGTAKLIHQAIRIYCKS
jgi:DNA-binding transcriptional MerR regulator